jgi:hypothetical protein
MATTSRDTVQAPSRQPPVLTLIGASRTLQGDTSPDTGEAVRWEGGGVEFEALPCNTETVPYVPGCTALDLDNALERPSIGKADTISLWKGVRCSSRPRELERGEARARQLLLVDQHRQLEHEFWTGDVHLAATPDLEGRWLAQDGVVEELSQDAPLLFGLAALQEALGSGSGAGIGCGRGMIHCTLTTASLWFSASALRREGGLLLDVFDNIIVPGVGYDGSAPDGTVDASGETAWAYATGIVDTRLAEILTRSAHDPADNDVDAIASREAIAYWDGCCHYGVNVNLCNTACA